MRRSADRSPGDVERGAASSLGGGARGLARARRSWRPRGARRAHARGSSRRRLSGPGAPRPERPGRRARHAAGESPRRIVLLASSPSERQAVFALVAGARGYCDRGIAPSLVRKAAEVVQRGEIWIGRHVVPHLVRRITSLTPAKPGRRGRAGACRRDSTSCAPREREIALLVGAGANNREIATRLSITESTVKAHLTSVFRKLDVSGPAPSGADRAASASGDGRQPPPSRAPRRSTTQRTDRIRRQTESASASGRTPYRGKALIREMIDEIGRRSVAGGLSGAFARVSG